LKLKIGKNNIKIHKMNLKIIYKLLINYISISMISKINLKVYKQMSLISIYLSNFINFYEKLLKFIIIYENLS